MDHPPPDRRIQLLLSGVLALSAFLQFAFLGREGLGHPYYAAGVKSMALDWRNFFFCSLDPSGFISLDKPPLSLWVQALLVRVLGFHGWVLILPQAVSTVLSVALLFLIVRRRFGDGTGLLAALLLALTPVAVAVGRNSTMDGMLVLTVLGSAAFFLEALRTGRLAPLLLCALLTGLAFNVKMGQGLMALPAMALAYLLYAPLPTAGARWRRLLAAGALTAAVSLAWILAVDLTPPATRPFVGSTRGNSALELAVGHNMASRFHRSLPWAGSASIEARRRFPPDRKMGFPGLHRVLGRTSGPQMAWFLPLALLGLAAAFRRGAPAAERGEVVFWGVWAISNLAFFALSRGLLHPHYLVMLGPPLAALAAVAVAREGREASGSRWGLPGALLATALLQAFFVLRAGSEALGLLLFLLPAGVLAAGSLRRSVLARAAMALLLAAPLYWSVTPLIHGGHPTLPYAGPGLKRDYLASQRFIHKRKAAEVEALVERLRADRRGAQYLAGVTDAQGFGADLLLATGEPVLVLGGFLGNDEPLSLEGFRILVREGRLRRFVMPLGTFEKVRPNRPANREAVRSNREILEWVARNGEREDLPGAGTGVVLFRLTDGTR
jgi:4-amino-4-deoxy-L-arabinose transferase-like glycosyltransferase